MNALPEKLVQKITSFMDIPIGVALGDTCREMHAALEKLWTARELFHNDSRSMCTDVAYDKNALPVVLQHLVSDSSVDAADSQACRHPNMFEATSIVSEHCDK